MPRKRSDCNHIELARRPDSPCWQFKHYDPAARKVRLHSPGTTDRREAERLLRDLVRAGGVAALRAPVTVERPTKLTIPIVLEAYYEGHACHLPSAEQARIAKAHLITHFGALPVEEIDMSTQQDYVDQRLIAGRAPKTVSRELSVLRASLYFAQQNGRLSVVPQIYDLPEIVGKTRWLTEEEFSRLLEAARSPHFALYLLLGIATAARPSSLLDLRWDQVDFAAGIIHLNPWGREQTTKVRPTVRMTSQLQAALEDAYAHRETEYVIEYAGYAINSIRTAFEQATRRAGISDGSVTPYTLRHTAATWLAKDGTPLWDIAHLLGHSPTRMVEKHYAHFHPSFQEKAIATLERQLGNAAVAPQLHPKLDNRAKNAARRKRRNGVGQNAKMAEASRGYLEASEMVVPTGIEPVTPTMST